MSTVGQREIRTQKHVIQIFKNELGYDYLGRWQDREGNSNVEEGLLTDWLERQGYSDKIITKVLHELSNARALGGSKTLYDANREVHSRLRYGVKVKPDVGEQNITVWLIDWENIDNNDFAIAEEVTVVGENTKRPDICCTSTGSP
jgi:type I restriction enzyme R subunit